MDPNMMMQGGMMGPGMMGPSMEEQIAEAKPMLKNIDTTTKKFIDTHCHIDVMYKKEQYDFIFLCLRHFFISPALLNKK